MTQSRLLKERDAFKDDTSELIQVKKKLEFDLRMQIMSSKQKIDKLEKDLKSKTDQYEKAIEDLAKVDK